MKRIMMTAIALAVGPALAMADDKAASDKAVPGGHSDKTMTKKLGDEVPTMTSDEKPMDKSKAPESETYTGAVGENVPEMTSPSGSDSK